MKRLYNQDERFSKHVRRHGRAFYSDNCIAEFIKDRLAHNGRLKREGKVDVRFNQQMCSCGNPSCTLMFGDSIDKKTFEANHPKITRKLPPPTKHPKRKEHPMFRGKIIEKTAPVKQQKSRNRDRSFMIFQDDVWEK